MSVISKTSGFYNVTDIFGNVTEIPSPKKASAGSIKKKVGVSGDRYTWAYSKHKEDAIDKIVKEYGQGTGYSRWQQERYANRVDREKHKKIITLINMDISDGSQTGFGNILYQKADFNYDRNRQFTMGC